MIERKRIENLLQYQRKKIFVFETMKKSIKYSNNYFYKSKKNINNISKEGLFKKEPLIFDRMEKSQIIYDNQE